MTALHKPHPDPKFAINPKINEKVALWRGDSCVLEIEAIVNAANTSLLGGGGIDGAIHRAAGRGLLRECSTLGGCRTGETKLTQGYELPAQYVLHTVGPVGENPEMLRSCYSSILGLVEKHHLRSVGFCGVSTGIFGYPIKKAAHIALSTVREWLEQNADTVDLLIFVVFRYDEVSVYEELMPVYFPAV